MEAKLRNDSPPHVHSIPYAGPNHYSPALNGDYICREKDRNDAFDVPLWAQRSEGLYSAEGRRNIILSYSLCERRVALPFLKLDIMIQMNS